jgi:sugar phosphate permease
MPSQSMDPRFKRWRYRVFAATWLSYFGFYFARKPFFITKSALQDHLSIDPTMLGVVGTCYLVSYTIGQFLAGALGNRFGPRLVLLSGMTLSLLANAAFGVSNSWLTFAVFMTINGLAQATGWSCNVGTMAQWFRKRERGTVMGLWATNFQVGGVAANTLAAWTLGEFGYQWSFFTGSAVLTLITAFFAFNARNQPSDVGLPNLPDEDTPDQATSTPATPATPTRAASGEPAHGTGWTRDVWINVLLIGVFYFFIKFIRYAFWSWAPYLLNRHYGLSLADAGYVSTIFDVSGILGVLCLGVASDRLLKGHRIGISLVFILAMAASCVLLYVAGPHSLTLFAVSMGLIGFFLYGPDAILTSAGAMDVGSLRGATLAAGVINGMGSVGSVVQELLLASILSGDAVGGVFATLLTSALFAAAALFVVWRRRRPQHAHA